MPYINDVKCLVHRGLGVEGEGSIDLGRDLAGDDLEDLLAELYEEVVEGIIDLLVDRALGALHVADSGVQECGIFGLLGGSQDEGGVGRSILGLVLGDSCAATVSGRPISEQADGVESTDRQSHLARILSVSHTGRQIFIRNPQEGGAGQTYQNH